MTNVFAMLFTFIQDTDTLWELQYKWFSYIHDTCMLRPGVNSAIPVTEILTTRLDRENHSEQRQNT